MLGTGMRVAGVIQGATPRQEQRGNPTTQKAPQTKCPRGKAEKTSSGCSLVTSTVQLSPLDTATATTWLGVIAAQPSATEAHLQMDLCRLARPDSRQHRACAACPRVCRPSWAAQRCPASCRLRDARGAARLALRSGAGRRGDCWCRPPHGFSCVAQHQLSISHASGTLRTIYRPDGQTEQALGSPGSHGTLNRAPIAIVAASIGLLLSPQITISHT